MIKNLHKYLTAQPTLAFCQFEFLGINTLSIQENAMKPQHLTESEIMRKYTSLIAEDEQPVDEGFSNYDGTELNFYHVVVDFLIEANTPEEARKKVTEYNFAKVQERGNGWHNFDVIKVKQTRDVI